MKVPGNNYALVARNCGYFYYYLGTYHDDLFSNRLHILVMTGLLDGMVYIEEGQIRKEDIAECLNGALLGKISVDHMQIQIGQTPDLLWTDAGVYLSFLMNFETLLFTRDNPSIKPKNVAKSVLASVDEISASVQSVRNEIQDTGYPKEVRELVERIVADLNFVDIKKWLDSLQFKS